MQLEIDMQENFALVLYYQSALQHALSRGAVWEADSAGKIHSRHMSVKEIKAHMVSLLPQEVADQVCKVEIQVSREMTTRQTLRRMPREQLEALWRELHGGPDG